MGMPWAGHREVPAQELGSHVRGPAACFAFPKAALRPGAASAGAGTESWM